MTDLRTLHSAREDWEDWSDGGDTTAPIGATAHPLSPSKSPSQPTHHSKIRLRSRKRQKHQHERLGIRLVTDMARFRKGPHHVAQLVQPSPGPVSSKTHINSFTDASALRALEGSANLTPDSQHTSPHGNKIVIGMAMPEEHAAARAPTDRLPVPSRPTNPVNHLHYSTWSPDSEDAYSPVPALPSHLKNSTKASEVDDDDSFTPVTLFEEDGSKSPTSPVSNISPETTRSRSGWWDHVETPFKTRFSPTPRLASGATSPDAWWEAADKKTGNTLPQNAASDASSSTLRPKPRSEKTGVVVREEHSDPSDVPPPYELTPFSKQHHQYRAVFPQSHDSTTQFPPSRRPDLHNPINGQGLLNMAYMSDVPLTPARIEATAPHVADAPLPDRVAGTYVGDHHQTVRGASPAAKIEKTRRRHEKEDYLAHKLGGFGKGRACLTGCYGRSGREGRQRRRCWLIGCLVFLALITTGIVVGLVASHQLRHRTATATATATSSASGRPSATTSSPNTSSTNAPDKAHSVWLNLTSFPPIPTGLATVVGPNNSEAISGCVAPATLWSCALPPEEQAANEPSDASQPTFIFQIQYDNNTRMLWNIPNGDAPTPSTRSSTQATRAPATTGASAPSGATTDGLLGSDPGRRRRPHARRAAVPLYDTGIAPDPAPPGFAEMWFLGNWTDGIVSASKAGEPTPFYISFFATRAGSAGPNMLDDDSPPTPNTTSTTTTTSSSSTTTTTTTTTTITTGTKRDGVDPNPLPAPLLNVDGTGRAAQLRPLPFQQPLRLYDRGLPTEHYGFYSYFTKTIYVASTANNNTSSTPAAAAAAAADDDDDNDAGGVRATSAAWYAAWTQTRFVVQIWTRRRRGGRGGGAAGADAFPYPLTVAEDTHGGDLTRKRVFAYGVGAGQRIDTTRAAEFDNNIGFGGAVVNAAQPEGDLSWGGTDGGRGGCRCEWVNWVDAAGLTADKTFG